MTYNGCLAKTGSVSDLSFNMDSATCVNENYTVKCVRNLLTVDNRLISSFAG